MACSNFTIFADHLCVECGARFKTTNTLNNHMKVHTEDSKRYACEHCPQRFRIKSDLIFHYDVHNDKKYECEICQSKLNSYVSLKTHKSK